MIGNWDMADEAMSEVGKRRRKRWLEGEVRRDGEQPRLPGTQLTDTGEEKQMCEV